MTCLSLFENNYKYMKEITSLREQSIDWFFQKTEDEKIDLKHKYFADKAIDYSKQWGFHFTFGQIEEMYRLDNKL
jgi:hypothetical protein